MPRRNPTSPSVDLRPPLLRAHAEHPEIDRHPHGLIAHPVRMQLVAEASHGIVGHELGLHAAGLRVCRDAIEIHHAVEYAARADEAVELPALLVLQIEAVRGVAAA